MEQYCSNGTVQDHNCRLNNSLRMGSGYLMDTHNMTLFSKKKIKKISELERSRRNKSRHHEVPTVSYSSLFLFRLDEACFFQPNNLKCTGENKFPYSK